MSTLVQEQKSSPPETKAPAAETAAPRKAAEGAGYDAQKAALSPRKDEKFDQFKLTPEVQALFKQLASAKDKEIEAIMNALIKTHKVPKATVEAVIEANKAWYATTWGAIKGGSWHTVGTNDKGEITHEFKLDQKGLGWENAGHKVSLDVKAKKATYQNKDGEWQVAAGEKDGRGTLDVQTGNKTDGLSEYHAEGGGDGGGLAYKHTKGKDTHEGKAGVKIGDTSTVNGEYAQTVDGVTNSGKASYKFGGKTATAAGTYAHKEGKDSSKIDAKIHHGEKVGAEARAKLDSQESSLDAGASGSKTTKDDATTVEAGADATYTHKPVDKKGKPIPGEKFTIKASGKVKKTDKTNGDGSTKVSTNGGVAFKNTNINGSYANESGTAGGEGFQVQDMKLDFDRKWDLDEADKESFTLGTIGTMRLSDKKDEEDTYTGTLTGHWVRGQKDDKEYFKFKMYGGHEKMGKIGALSHGDADMYNGDKGYGNFGQLSLGYGKGGHNFGLDGMYGQSDTSSVMGAHAHYDHKGKNSVDLYASAATKDEETATLLRLNTKFVLSEGLTLSSGGSLKLTPGTAGHSKLWEIHSGLGFDLKNDMDLTIKMGVAGNGENVYYVPELMYQWDNKISLSAIGSIRDDGAYGVGAKVGIPKAGVTFFGGYGDMSQIANPYRGNAGMQMPAWDDSKMMGQQGANFTVGVSVDMLPAIKSVGKFLGIN